VLPPGWVAVPDACGHLLLRPEGDTP